MKKTFTKALVLVMCLCMLGCSFIGCAKRNTYVIGATGPLTGENSSYGISVQNGAKLAIDEINAAGGLNGVKFSFVMMDDEAKADKVNSAYDSLIKKGMQVSIGSVTSGACIQFASLSKADNLFFITPSASTAKVIEESNAYRVCFGDPDQGVLAADELAKTYTNIGVIYNSSDSYSSGIYEAFDARMKELNKTFTKTSFTNDSKTTFSTQISTLKSAGCDVLFLPIYYQEAWLIIQEAANQNFTTKIFGCDGLDGIVKYAEDSGKTSLLSGVKYLTPFDAASKDEKVSAFVTAYKNKYNETPDQFAADGYDAVMVIYEAMKKAGIDDVKISASDLCNKITPIISGDFTYVGATGSMTWDSTGAPTKSPTIITID